MNTQQLTAEHHLLKALHLEAEGLYTEAISSYKRAYKLKPSLEYEKVVTFMVDGQEYDAHGQIVGVDFVVAEDGTGTFKEDFTPKAVVPDKFEAGDPNALKYLEENGYVVFSNVADKQQIEKAKSLFWEHVEFFTTVSRTDVSSWTNEAWPGDLSNGIVSDIGIGQSAFLWYLRTLPNVKKAFGSVWSDNDLLVSFDGCGTFRPVEYNKKWRTRGGWFHIDQNLYQKKGRHCVQGLMNVFKSGENDGGFVVVPQSHQMMERAFENDKELCRVDVGDYYRLSHDIEFWEDELKNHSSLYSHQHALRPIKLCLEPGDFVMWDSRTVHCNHPPTKLSTEPEAENTLKRLVAYICMTPAKLATNLEDLVENRVFAFKNGISTSHWPHEYHPTSAQRIEGLGPQSPLITLSPEDLLLVFGSQFSSKYASEF